jgi:probable O-glycosylation ligase (exosortase A-associated)
MLRTLAVLALTAVGVFFALQGAFYALLLYLWVAYFRPQEWVWTDFVQNLNLSFLAGIYLIAVTLVSREQHRLNGRIVLILLFLVQTFVALMASANTDLLWGQWQDFAKTAGISYVIVVLVTDRTRLRLALLVMTISLGFEPAKQAWAQFAIAPGSKNFNSIGFLGDESGVGVGMLMLAPVAAILARTTSARWLKWTLRVIAIGVLYRAVTTYSRGAFLGLVALALVFFVRSERKPRALVVAVMVGALILPVLPDAFWERMGTITTTEDQMEISSRGRVHFWRVAAEMAERNPLTGVGPNGYNAAYDRYDFTNGEYGTARSVHSTWFGILAETGYPGLVLFVLNIIGVFFACRRVRRLASKWPELRELREYALALEVGFAAFCVAGSFIIFQFVELLWHLIAISIALMSIAEAEAAALEEGTGRAAALPVESQAVTTRARPVGRAPLEPVRRQPDTGAGALLPRP